MSSLMAEAPAEAHATRRFLRVASCPALLPSAAVTPLIVIVAGLVAIAGGSLLLRSYGPRMRVGRLLAVTPRVSIAEARAIAASGGPRYVRVDGRHRRRRRVPGREPSPARAPPAAPRGATRLGLADPRRATRRGPVPRARGARRDRRRRSGPRRRPRDAGPRSRSGRPPRRRGCRTGSPSRCPTTRSFASGSSSCRRWSTPRCSARRSSGRDGRRCPHGAGPAGRSSSAPWSRTRRCASSPGGGGPVPWPPPSRSSAGSPSSAPAWPGRSSRADWHENPPRGGADPGHSLAVRPPRRPSAQIPRRALPVGTCGRRPRRRAWSATRCWRSRRCSSWACSPPGSRSSPCG